MIPELGSVTQALLGTLMTWGLTAAGAAMVIFIRGSQRKLLDLALGFAAGVMIAASFWSLLAPAIELAETSGSYGEDGEFAFLPIAAGFLLGAIFVFGMDKIVSYMSSSAKKPVKISGSDVFTANSISPIVAHKLENVDKADNEMDWDKYGEYLGH